MCKLNNIKKGTLILLDLDHTIIYGSYAETETAKFLFAHNKYLKVYERPMARELVQLCKEIGDIIVFTTALKDYAKRICKELDINPIELYSRKNCEQIDNHYKKELKKVWKTSYQKILVIDDSPNVWQNAEGDHIKFIIPKEFRGSNLDHGLKRIIEDLQSEQ